VSTSRSSPRDYTGRQRQKLQAQYAEAVKAREGEIGMTQSVVRDPGNEVIDMVTEEAVPQEGEDGAVTYVEAPARTIRVNADIENMTYGYGNVYDLKEGQLYRLPAVVCDHLEELGYVWH
jgi:lipopolysaccharide biosynthesis regulator YciM